LPDALRKLLATLAEGSRKPLTALAEELHGLLELGDRINVSKVRDMIPTLCERKHFGRQGSVPKQRAQLNDHDDDIGDALLVWETVNLALAADQRTAFEATRKARREVEKRVKVLDKLLLAIDDGGDVDRIQRQREKWREFEIQDEKLRAKDELRKQKDEERKRLQEEKEEAARQREEKKKQEQEEKEEKRRRQQEEKDKMKEEREKAAEEERELKRRKQDNDLSSEKEPRKSRTEVHVTSSLHKYFDCRSPSLPSAKPSEAEALQAQLRDEKPEAPFSLDDSEVPSLEEYRKRWKATNKVFVDEWSAKLSSRKFFEINIEGREDIDVSTLPRRSSNYASRDGLERKNANARPVFIDLCNRNRPPIRMVVAHASDAVTAESAGSCQVPAVASLR
jgi:DNA repair exonuclease SbcCD ATPase subunit